jgi:hypothetical protein
MLSLFTGRQEPERAWDPAGQLLRQGDSQVFKKYSRMKLQMQREALAKLNRHANEMSDCVAETVSEPRSFGTVLAQ